MAEQEYRRSAPQNELDLALMTTDAVWGKPEVSEELRAILNKQYMTTNEKGETGYTIKSLWGLLGYYTRDFRLANLNNAQLEYTKHYIDLAGDCLQENLIRPFLISLSRAATILELSQSRGGFLRKRMGTLTSESFTEQKEPQKRNFFGGNKKSGGNYE